ncbi:MAG TPA: hypothetical protein VGL38_03475 [bacterium]
MNKKLGISMAVLVAVAVVSIGVASFACGGHGASSNQVMNSFEKSGAACPYSGCGSAANCPYMKQMQDAQKSSNQMTCNHSSSIVYYGANVFDVCDGRQYAVCEGKVFEVHNDTPFVDMGDARYYVADECMKPAFQADPEAVASELDREAVALATVDGNVIGNRDGQILAKCPVTGQVFIVTADSPVKVRDGKRYYLSDTVNLSAVESGIHN